MKALTSISSFTFKVTGVFYKDDEIINEIVNTMNVGDTLILRTDPTNKYDSKAVLVFFNDLEIGYVEREGEKNEKVGELISSKKQKECKVFRAVFNEGKCPIVYGEFFYIDDIKPKHKPILVPKIEIEPELERKPEPKINPAEKKVQPQTPKLSPAKVETKTYEEYVEDMTKFIPKKVEPHKPVIEKKKEEIKPEIVAPPYDPDPPKDIPVENKEWKDLTLLKKTDRFTYNILTNKELHGVRCVLFVLLLLVFMLLWG